jgi:hypothetical protein
VVVDTVVAVVIAVAIITAAIVINPISRSAIKAAQEPSCAALFFSRCFIGVNMVAKNKPSEYYCVAVQRNYEPQWRIISKHNTPEEAQAEIDARRSYTGAFNYDNAEFRIISRAEGKKEFGKKWEYAPIGAHSTKAPEKS